MRSHQFQEEFTLLALAVGRLCSNGWTKAQVSAIQPLWIIELSRTVHAPFRNRFEQGHPSSKPVACKLRRVLTPRNPISTVLCPYDKATYFQQSSSLIWTEGTYHVMSCLGLICSSPQKCQSLSSIHSGQTSLGYRVLYLGLAGEELSLDRNPARSDLAPSDHNQIDGYR